MKNFRRWLFVCGLLTFASTLPRDAAAFDSAWWGGWPICGLGGYYGSSVYNSGRLPVPPYFSVHPPVYYGQRIRAIYGDSPYAQPASRWTQGNSPVIIINPFMTATDHGPAPSSGQPAANGPQVIENPHFQPMLPKPAS